MFRRPLRKLESVLYICIVGVLAAVLLDRLLTYAELAERAAVQATLARLQAGLYLRLARAVITRGTVDVRGWGQQNPFELANDRPGNYLGERANPEPRNMARGFWFFDSVTKEIVYVPDQSRHLQRPQGEPPVLRYRLALSELSPAGLPASLAFVPSEPIIWGR